jgi:EAL domain-containing protein (putative c-di-GMP-specific phosphodiesterase class I)
LHKKIIAEFVEDAETLEWLAAMGIDYAQGYYVGKPSMQLPGTTRFPLD